ncbi:hypothetical protein QE431_001295 [Flavobacterium sp. SORGH_AS 622]|nr:hypothetical protein [Flavobacterium sp. SORGH_AS_0622]
MCRQAQLIGREFMHIEAKSSIGTHDSSLFYFITNEMPLCGINREKISGLISYNLYRKKHLNFVTLKLLIVKHQTKYNESRSKKSGAKSTLE